jgi:hypothetical protein
LDDADVVENLFVQVGDDLHAVAMDGILRSFASI